jgi:hypothetical protein
MAMTIEKADAMPKVRRGGRTSEDREQLKAVIANGETNVIRGVEIDKEYNAVQQRIRQAAKAINLSVHVTLVKNDDGKTGDIFFEGYSAEAAKKATPAKAAPTKATSTKAQKSG